MVCSCSASKPGGPPCTAPGRRADAHAPARALQVLREALAVLALRAEVPLHVRHALPRLPAAAQLERNLSTAR